MSASSLNGKSLSLDKLWVNGTQITGGGGGGGVSQLIAGPNITLNPTGGTGAVTVSATSTIGAGAVFLGDAGGSLATNNTGTIDVSVSSTPQTGVLTTPTTIVLPPSAAGASLTAPNVTAPATGAIKLTSVDDSITFGGAGGSNGTIDIQASLGIPISSNNVTDDWNTPAELTLAAESIAYTISTIPADYLYDGQRLLIQLTGNLNFTYTWTSASPPASVTWLIKLAVTPEISGIPGDTEELQYSRYSFIPIQNGLDPKVYNGTIPAAFAGIYNVTTLKIGEKLFIGLQWSLFTGTDTSVVGLSTAPNFCTSIIETTTG